MLFARERQGLLQLSGWSARAESSPTYLPVLR